MKILVTGATGFLGKRTCEFLSKQGHKVVGVGRNASKAPAGVVFIQTDLTAPLPEMAWQGVEAAVHCAAKSSVWGKYEEFYRNNVLATRLLAEQACAHKIKRFVHISSTSVYFDFKDRRSIAEETSLPVNKANSYAQTKYLAEQEVLRIFRQGLPAVILRPRAIFGPGDTALLPRLLRVNNTRFFPEFKSDDGPLTDITHVDNVVQAICCALQAPEICNGQIYNITNGEPILLKATVRKLVQALGYTYHGKRLPFDLVKAYAYLSENFYKMFLPHREPPFTVYSVGLVAKDQTFCIDKARNELGYQPKISVQEGISDVINHWKY